MYFWPQLDCIGKRPVRSVYIWPESANVVLAKRQCVRLPMRSERVGAAVILGWVERTALRCWLRWHFTVASDFGRCLRTKVEVRPGQARPSGEVASIDGFGPGRCVGAKAGDMEELHHVCLGHGFVYDVALLCICRSSVGFGICLLYLVGKSMRGGQT
jgi:hypothetical protein